MRHGLRTDGMRVLVVEDDAILALDLSMIVEDAGHTVEGPFHRLHSALAFERFERVDVAILDVDICGEEVFPFADRCSAASLPIILHTGRRDVAPLRARCPGAVILGKPSTPESIVAAIDRAVTPTHAGYEMRCAAAF